ncbi:MAG: adenylate/guanylate cyclase domain-containing protein [Pseudomonadota bacterium]
MQRRLTTIMVADVVGFSRLMEQAEEATAEQITACHTLISKTVESGGGRVFNRAGDAALAEFDSPINAVRSAVAIREKLTSIRVDDTSAMQMRFGLHLADVIVSDDGLLGDGVNLAARIQQDAEADAICVSQPLFDQIKRQSPFAFEDLGERSFKNLSQPMRVYQVRGPLETHRLQSAPTRLGRPKSPIVHPNAIAVLPFRCEDGDEDQRYLAEGLTEEVILELARFKKLHVASRSACFAFSGDDATVSKMVEELGVDYVLEGRVRRQTGKVRLTLELINGATGMQAWSDRMTRAYDDVFDLMDTMNRRIAATILGRVEADAIETARRKPPENMGAYDFMLRGLDHHRHGSITWDNMREAVHWFDRAIEADPAYGPAYAWRICASSWLPEFDFETERWYIDRAIELDPFNPEAQRIMGVVMMMSGDYDAARYHHQRAMELSPNDAYILARSSAFYTFNGQPEVALKLLDKAEELDPLLPVWCVEERGVALYALDRLDDAIKALSELPFQTFRARFYQCACLMNAGRTDEAKATMQIALAINGELNAEAFMGKESWRSGVQCGTLRKALLAAGLPPSESA